MTLADAVARYVFGTLRTDELPDAAIQALEDGLDSPCLRQLAGAQGADPDDIRRILGKTLAELGISIPSRPQAGLLLAQSIARQVLGGKLTPYDGARQIWGVYVRAADNLDELLPFVGLCSQYEDDAAHRAEYTADIIDSCKALLNLQGTY